MYDEVLKIWISILGTFDEFYFSTRSYVYFIL